MAGINVPVGIKNARFKAGLDEMRGQAKKFAGDVRGEFTSSFGSIKSSIAGAFGVGAIVAFTKRVIDFGSELNDSAERLNLNVESLQGLGYAFGQSGAKQDDFEKGMVKLNQNIDAAREGNETMIRSFEKLGVTWADLATKSPEEILMLIADGMRDAKNPTEALAAAMDILGRAGIKMVPGLRAGADELKRLRDEARKLSEEDVKTLDELGDAVSRYGNKVKVFGAQVLLGLGKAGKYILEGAARTGMGGSFSPEEEKLPVASGYSEDPAKEVPEDPRVKKGEAKSADNRQKLETDIARLQEDADKRRMSDAERLDELLGRYTFALAASGDSSREATEEELRYRKEALEVAKEIDDITARMHDESQRKADAEERERERAAKEAKEKAAREKTTADEKKAEEKDAALPGIASVSADSLQSVGGGGGIGTGSDPQVRELQSANSTLRLILGAIESSRRADPGQRPPVK